MLEALAQNRAAVIGNLRMILVVFYQYPESVRRISTVPIEDFMAEIFDDWIDRLLVVAVVRERLRAVAKQAVEERRHVFFRLRKSALTTAQCRNSHRRWRNTSKSSLKRFSARSGRRSLLMTSSERACTCSGKGSASIVLALTLRIRTWRGSKQGIQTSVSLEDQFELG
jgi:hypothetical protein